jgi:isoquinoline 1-oxidoreductase alpha subunit
VEAAMNGNICRCGTYKRIKDAVMTAAKRNS